MAFLRPLRLTPPLFSISSRSQVMSFRHRYSSSASDDPFGLPSSPSPLRFLQPSPSQQQQQTQTPPTSSSSASDRLKPSAHRQREETERLNDPTKRASLDQLWSLASRPVHVTHHGPLSVTSSRFVTSNRAVEGHFTVRPTDREDLERAMRRLNGMVSRAKLRREANLSKRYEKPYQKRRRLMIERSRRRFAAEVQRRVQIVNTLRMRGL